MGRHTVCPHNSAKRCSSCPFQTFVCDASWRLAMQVLAYLDHREKVRW